ncbi:MAG: murein biosynthesis integral membrane protein MurJ [Acidimicrobiia bacterium]|nr:murein biosynthesis integral membrane protein MurJ [Acidimicrobiia bacterium]
MTDAPSTPAGSTRGALVRSSALVAVGTGLSRVTGLVRVFAFMYALDQTLLTDSYTIANNMPNLIYELLLGGVLSATLVPIFTERLRDDDGGISAVVSVAAIVLAVVTVVGFFAAPAILAVYSGALDGASPAEVEAYREVGTTLLRYFMPQVFFYGLVTVVTALLHARRSFAAPAYSPVLNNLVVSAMFISLPHLIDRNLSSDGALVEASADSRLLLLLGLGTTAGVAAMALALVPSLLRQQVRLRFRPDVRHPAVRSLLALSGWTVGYVVANQVALSIVLWLAQSQDPGDATAYSVAFIFFQLPHGLFAVSIMTTFLPELTVAAQAGDDDAFRERFVLGLRLLALVILPASAGYAALSGPVVSLLPLGASASDVTAGVLAAFSVGLFGFSVYLFALRAFYARKDTRTPFKVNVVENALNVGLAIPLVVLLGVRGLAGAYSLAYLVAAVLAVRALSRAAGGLGLRAAAGPLLRMGVAAVACGAAAWLAAELVGPAAPIVRVAVGVPAGAVAYGALLVVFRVEEVDTARRMVAGRLRSRQS